MSRRRLMKSSGGMGMGGRRSGSVERYVGKVKDTQTVQGSRRRVDVVIQEEGSSNKEKASIYMKNKYAKDVKVGGRYEFEVEPRVKDKIRGQGDNVSGRWQRKTYNCESEPGEISGKEGADLSRFGKSGSKSKWFHY